MNIGCFCLFFEFICVEVDFNSPDYEVQRLVDELKGTGCDSFRIFSLSFIFKI
jgi:hypothetical protein